MIEHEEWGLVTIIPLHPPASRNVSLGDVNRIFGH